MKYSIVSLIIFGLSIIGCYADSVRPPSEKIQIDMKFCTEACISSQFQNFHNKGDSWGTGSSSMNGLSQKQIYTAVQNYCSNFYKNVKCCEFNHEYTKDKISIYTNHGYKYGQCR